MVFLGTFTAAIAQVPSYIPTDGLAGWWPFNGNANDESGNGNDGVVNGATVTEDRFGNAGKAYAFDGIDDFIEVANSATNTITGDLTMSAWVKTIGSNGQNYQTVISKRETYWTWEYAMGLSYHDGIIHNTKALAARGLGMGNQEQAWSNTPYEINSWELWTATFSSGEVRLYKNGILDYSAPFNLVPNPQNSPLLFGRNTLVDNSEQFNGSLDDIGIWNRALTEQEIQNLYTGTTPTPCISLSSNLQQGLVGYWPFCGNANDESGNGNDGVVNGATLTEDRFGNAGKAYAFDGVDDKISGTLTNPISLNSQSKLSISGWMLFGEGSLAEIRTLAYLRDDIVGSGYNVAYDQILGKIKGFCGQEGTAPTMEVVGEAGPNVGTWYFITLVCDLEAGVTKFYINSILQDTSNELLVTGEMNEFGFGKLTEAWEHLGSLDDIGIWNRALTPEEVYELYTLDACTFTVYDTLTVYETVYDTVYTYETIYDTVTTYVTVTDTLLIDINFTGFEGQPSWLNTVIVFPNPTSDRITIDYGNFALMAGYSTIITDAAGATVYSSSVNNQQVDIDINAWGATGVYYMSIYDTNGALVAVRHIMLE